MMLKAFFLSQVAHAIGLPENVPGDILYSTDAGVTGMAPPSENILRRSADRHRIERKIVGRLLKGSNRRDPYQRAVEKSTWGKVAVVGTTAITLINVCFYFVGGLIPHNDATATLIFGFGSIAGVMDFVFGLTTLIFALLHATGWFRVNAAIIVGAVITSVGIAIYMYKQVWEFFLAAMEASKGRKDQISAKLTAYLKEMARSFPYTMIAWALTGLVWLIASFAHQIRGAWIPAYRLLF